MDNQQCLLRVEGISKTFPDVQALSNVSLESNSGEILAMVGENGAGRTELTRALIGLDSSTGDEVFIEDNQSHSPWRRYAPTGGVGVPPYGKFRFTESICKDSVNPNLRSQSVCLCAARFAVGM